MTPADVRVRTVDVPGCRLSVAVGGSGPAVLLLHGWPHTWQVWTAVVPALAATHTVVAPDLRGLGASERVSGPYDAGTVADDLHALLDRLEVPDAAVMALDASVPAAFLLGMRHPERVRALVLMESLLMPLPGAAMPPWLVPPAVAPPAAPPKMLASDDRPAFLLNSMCVALAVASSVGRPRARATVSCVRAWRMRLAAVLMSIPSASASATSRSSSGSRYALHQPARSAGAARGRSAPTKAGGTSSFGGA